MIASEQTLAALALEHPECEDALRLLGLDYACHGARSLAEACAGRGLPLAQALTALEAAAAQGPDPMLLDARGLATAELISELVVRHHAYARSALRVVVDLASKVAQVHGERYLIELDAGVALLARLVQAQLEREEARLFPLLSAGEAGPGLPALLRSSREAHEQVVDLLGRLRAVAGGFAPPAEACRSQRSLYAELAALEQDLVRHAHLELNVLHARF